MLKKEEKIKLPIQVFIHPHYFLKKHNHIIIIFDKFKIIFNDPRRFGFLKMLSSKRELKSFFSNYGPEPFDKKFDINYLKNKLSKKTKNIKNYLLDQKFVSGIGNIYANEILFFCKIKPFTQSGKLKIDQYKNIIFYSKKVLTHAIKKGGSSIQNFKNIDGNKGLFQDNFKVYQRENLKCLRKKMFRYNQKKKWLQTDQFFIVIYVKNSKLNS